MSPQESFENAYPSLRRMALVRFRDLSAEAREEAASVAIALAWKYYLRLVETKTPGEAAGLMKSALYFACKHAATRDVQGMESGGDVYRRLERVWSAEGGEICDSFAGDGDDPADRAEARDMLDHVLGQMPKRHKRTAELLMLGYGTKDVAAMQGVSPSAISQFRTRFADLYAQG